MAIAIIMAVGMLAMARLGPIFVETAGDSGQKIQGVQKNIPEGPIGRPHGGPCGPMGEPMGPQCLLAALGQAGREPQPNIPNWHPWAMGPRDLLGPKT